MSRSSLRLGASEDESDALLGKGSGSRCYLRRRGDVRRNGRHGPHPGRSREFAEQAVALEAFDSHRQDLSDDGFGRHYMRRLKIGGAADNLKSSAVKTLICIFWKVSFSLLPRF